eukprot:9158107-Prorocentrum_lima.AAC.1
MVARSAPPLVDTRTPCWVSIGLQVAFAAVAEEPAQVLPSGIAHKTQQLLLHWSAGPRGLYLGAREAPPTEW